MGNIIVSVGNLTPVPTTRLATPSILVFDSGLGGLSVFREVARLRPDARFTYAADDAGFPYGSLGEAVLVSRVCEVMDALIADVHPDIVVVSCNTASTAVLPALRARHAIPFVGTVPAIKPACALSHSKQISVLATPGTVRRDYTAALIREFASTCTVSLVPSENLAGLVESILHGIPVDDEDLRAEIAPCFVRGEKGRTDTVVLACTHYPLIADRLAKVAPWPVTWVDPAPAIARRVMSLVGEAGAAGAVHPVRLLSTGAPLDSAAIQALIGRPVSPAELLPQPLAEAS
jgi:glutamate racemase